MLRDGLTKSKQRKQYSMNSKSYNQIVFALPILLGTTLLLAACLSTPMTQTAATSDANITAGVCSVWKNVSYSSKDTDQTRLEVRANNAARTAYCK
jgi:hypothetical protein